MRLKLALLFSIVSLSAYASLTHAAQTAPALLPGSQCAAFGTLSDVDNLMGNLFAAMIAYQKMVNREAREDRKIQRMSKDVALAAKEAKINQDNKSIDQQKNEAQQKADTAMRAATLSLASGIAANVIQISGSPVASKGSTNAPDIQRFTASANALKSDIARLTTEIKRDEASVNVGNAPAMSAADIETMKAQLDRGQQEIRRARVTAKPC